MELTKEQLDKLAACTTTDEVIAAAKAEGADITAEQAEVLMARFGEPAELSDESLDAVAGGDGCSTADEVFKECPKCQSYNVNQIIIVSQNKEINHCNACGYEWE